MTEIGFGKQAGPFLDRSPRLTRRIVQGQPAVSKQPAVWVAANQHLPVSVVLVLVTPKKLKRLSKVPDNQVVGSANFVPGGPAASSSLIASVGWEPFVWRAPPAGQDSPAVQESPVVLLKIE